MSDKYLILIKEPEWDPATVSQDDWARMSAAHGAFAEAVIAAGATVAGGEALKPTAEASIITPARNGQPAVFTDGPFTETNEVVSGFYLIEADGAEKAKELAALCPTGGWIEFYPVMDTTGTM